MNYFELKYTFFKISASTIKKISVDHYEQVYRVIAGKGRWVLAQNKEERRQELKVYKYIMLLSSQPANTQS